MLKLYNALSKQKELFVPINANHIKIYVCGPTVYDYIHIGNARPIIVFDTLYRLLSFLYPKVSYVRNITDIDDKIIIRALERNQTIYDLTNRTIKAFHDDIKKLNALNPTFEPQATDYIQEIQGIIKILLEKKHAYETNGHIYFDVSSYTKYGKLSGFSQEEIINGARIEISEFKKHPSDFVLWKPSKLEENCGWDSPWGYGRPGWHIECSAMSKTLLGDKFDIHGGGKDLIFPHHENEIAQSVCGSNSDGFVANYWIHNGFVVVEGQKMSKSLSNFITLHESLEKYQGETIRLSLLKTHYRQPLDFCESAITQSKDMLDKMYEALDEIKLPLNTPLSPSLEFMEAICEDLNTHLAINILYKNIMNLSISDNKEQLISSIMAEANILGILQKKPQEWFSEKLDYLKITRSEIEKLISKRNEAKMNKDFQLADTLRNKLSSLGIIIEDTKEGVKWKTK